MIFITVASLNRKVDGGFEGKSVAQCFTGASCDEDARRRIIVNTDVVQAVLEGWALCNVSAFEVKPEELLADNDLIKAFLVEMAKGKENDDG